jgi:hypothetical protein
MMFDQTQPYGMPQMGGYQYNGYQQQQAPKIMNVLSDEEIKTLQSSNSQFSLGLTQREVLQSACNHRKADGSETSLVYDPETGVARCTICGYEFRPIEADTNYDTIKDSADRLVDILQTIKLMYVDLPSASAREYFQIIPLIEKVPQLFQFAAKNFNKHEYNAWSYNNHNMGGVALFNNLNQTFGAPIQPQVNPYAGGMQQPVGYPQAAPMAGNPFYAQPAPQVYQPQSVGYQYQPPQTTTPVAPTVSAPTEAAPAVDTTATETVTQTVTV